MRTALITGITGQDGSYLADLLLAKGYQVHGIIRRSSSFNTGRIDPIYQDPHEPDLRLRLHFGDLTEALARSCAWSSRTRSITSPRRATCGCRSTSRSTPARSPASARSACSRRSAPPHVAAVLPGVVAELYGDTPPPQREDSVFRPRSPYAIAKLYSHRMVVNYREAYGLFASNGIMFNHESRAAARRS